MLPRSHQRTGYAFLSWEWGPLFENHLKFRDPNRKVNFSSAVSDDPDDLRAQRAQHCLLKHADVGKASAALRAPANPRPPAAGDLTRAFRKLNPQVGDEAPSVPELPGGGGDVPFRHSNLLQKTGMPTASLRRPLDPPDFPNLMPIKFTKAKIIKLIRRSSTASSGGPSGTNYRVLRSWFSDHDCISDDLTDVINLMVAGCIPKTILPFLNTGRGVVIPKNEQGELRPIVLGHILQRLIGSLAMSELSTDI